MRLRSIILFSVAFVLMLGGAICLVSARVPATPTIAVGVLGYNTWGRGPFHSVRVGITNTGRTAIRYNQMNFAGDASLRVESRNGWATRDIGPDALLPLMPALLKPGSNTFAFMLLPEGTLRWQIAYKIQGASLRDRVVLASRADGLADYARSANDSSQARKDHSRKSSATFLNVRITPRLQWTLRCSCSVPMRSGLIERGKYNSNRC